MHQVMVYHKKGEDVIDYLSGDPAHGYRVPLTKTEDKIEITTEKEVVEKDVELPDVVREEKNGVYRIHIKTAGKDSFGKEFNDKKTSLTLNFTAKLPEKSHVLTEKEIRMLGNANVRGYRAGRPDRLCGIPCKVFGCSSCSVCFEEPGSFQYLYYRKAADLSRAG